MEKRPLFKASSERVVDMGIEPANPGLRGK